VLNRNPDLEGVLAWVTSARRVTVLTDHDVLDRAIRASTRCDLVLAIGTSLQVTPASLLCAMAQRTGARTVIVNAEPTPFDERADAALRDRIGEVLPAIVN
jgi:NAD-dependent deacetylase